MKLFKVVMIGALTLSITSTSLFADAVKGQKLFSKLLKEPCGMTGAKFAAKHTQEEWTQIKESGKFGDEIMLIVLMNVNFCSQKKREIKQKQKKLK